MVVMDDGGGWAEESCISCWGGAASWDVDAGIHVGRCGRPCSPIMRRTASLNSSRLLWVPTIFPPPPPPSLGTTSLCRQSNHKNTPLVSLTTTCLILCSHPHLLHQSLHSHQPIPTLFQSPIPSKIASHWLVHGTPAFGCTIRESTR